MQIRPLELLGAFEITLAPRSDSRGYFVRLYDVALFEQHGLQTVWPQQNQSLSLRRHTLRGLHFQAPPASETKLIRVVRGAILDVFVDLRLRSPTYGRWSSIVLTEENWKMVYLPKGIAHGFCSLTDNAVVTYRVDEPYSPSLEGGILWNDPDLAIEWPVSSPVLSDRDQALPRLRDLTNPFTD